ncbi:sugar ABC transporter permease [Streptococcus pneumoniae]|nr:sugar ABC transporter permease [Streptococcus pneumoniae]VNI72750.1 sugar ABC transporter permease [Streptococcus pneumoniae]
MKQDERKALIGKYILLILGSVLILVPLLVLNRDSKMWTLPLFQYNYAGQYFNDYGPSFASYVVGIISITIVYLFFQRHIISGMSNGAVK